MTSQGKQARTQMLTPGRAATSAAGGRRNYPHAASPRPPNDCKRQEAARCGMTAGHGRRLRTALDARSESPADAPDLRLALARLGSHRAAARRPKRRRWEADGLLRGGFVAGSVARSGRRARGGGGARAYSLFWGTDAVPGGPGILGPPWTTGKRGDRGGFKRKYIASTRSWSLCT